jgi:hypothetical protein
MKDIPDINDMKIESVYTYTIAQPISVSFDPQPDITAYELAKLLPHFHGQPIYESDWASLGQLQRHLKRDS